MSVKFGLLVNLEDFDLMRRICVEADRPGYYSLAMGDHVEWDTLECWTALSAVAALTTRVRISQLVLNNTYRLPALLAKMAATLDRLSRGRLELGIGAGGTTPYAAYALPEWGMRQRLAMLEEALAIIEGLWMNAPVLFRGRCWRTEDAKLFPKPVQKPRPRVLMGGEGKVVMRLAARREAWNFAFDQPPPYCRAKIEQFATLCAKLGEDPQTVDKNIGCMFLMDENRQALEERIAEAAVRRNLSVGGFLRKFGDSFIGTPDDVVGKLQVFLDSGVNYFFLWGPGIRDANALEIFAKEIVQRKL